MGISIVLFGVPVFFSVWTLFMFLVFWVFSFMYLRKMMPKEKEHRLQKAAVIGMVLSFLSITGHEASHGIMATIVGETITKAGTHALGAYVVTATSPLVMAPWKEFLIVIAGPLFNLTVGGVLAFLVWLYPESLAENTIQTVCYVNLSLGWFNAFPVHLLDGGKAVDALARMIAGPESGATAFYLVLYIGLALPIWLFLRSKRIRLLVNELEDL